MMMIAMWPRRREARTVAAIWLAAWSVSSIYGQTSVLTWHNDNARTGQNLQETILTPAIDPQAGPHGTIYAVAMSKDGSGNYHQRLHALDLTTGAEQFGGPVEIQATYPGSGVEGAGGVLTFDPGQHKHRAALVILNG